MSSILKGIQQGCADQLAATPYFSNVTIITEQTGDIENAIQTALAKLGICVIVITPTANAAFPNYLKPYFNDIKIICRTVENVILNRSTSGTGKQASEVAEMVAVTLHQFEPLGISEVVVLDTPSITIAPGGTVGKLLCYDVRFKTAGGFDYTINQVATPVIAFSGDTFALSCSTPGAAIFYTTDGSTPSPGNPSASVWLGYQISGTYSIPNGVNTGTLTGLALPFTPSAAVMTVSTLTGDLILDASEFGSITSNGWGFNLNGFTDDTSYVLNWTAFSPSSMSTVSSGTKIRTSAWLAGQLTSKEAKATAP
jgi:hypothetical protein